MFYLTLVITICVYLRCIVSENKYVFINTNKTWTDAIEFCREKGGSLSALDEENIELVLQGCLKNDSVDLWTNTYRQASPYLSLTGCFEVRDSMNFTTMNISSVIDCQYHCRSTSTFAVMDNKCACLEDGDVTGLRVNTGFCNITCIEEMYCGGKNYMNIYDVVEQSYLDGAMLLEDPDYTSCLTYHCLNNTFTLTERNCEDPSITDVACNDYFSCTFELGEPCFLIDWDFDWAITNSITTRTTITAYEGSHFAYVNDLYHSPGYRSYLRSNINFPVKKWCLRFRYFISSLDETANITVFIYNSTQVLASTTYKQILNGKWQHATVNIDWDIVFKIGFKTVKSTTVSIFAIDDITMIAGTCVETTTQLLYMKGELRCNFEGGVDVCFNQSQDDNFDWTIRSGGTSTGGTGPGGSYEGNYYSYIEASDRRNNDVARLESKFDLQDVSVTFSMWYHMYGNDIRTLSVVLRNKTGGNRNIFSQTRNRGNSWKHFEDTFIVEGTWQLCIEANVYGRPYGDIAIDDIRIRINQNDFNNTWMNLNERCIKTLGTYPLTKDQVPNTPCLSNDRERWTGIVKPQRNGRTDRVSERSPSVVKVFNYYRNMSNYTWETFDRYTFHPFVCEKSTNSSDGNESCIIYSKANNAYTNHNVDAIGVNSEISIVILASVISCILVVLICVVAMVTVYRRKKKAMSSQLMRDENVPTPEDINSNDIALTENKPSRNNKTQNQTTSEESATPEEIYVNEDNAISHPKQNTKKHENTEEDYDHLHQIQSDNTPLKDDVYSHMTDGLYGSRENKEMITNEIYDQAMMNSEYGTKEVDQDVNETYDHAGFGAPDEVYSLPNKYRELTEDVYDSTTTNKHSAL